MQKVLSRGSLLGFPPGEGIQCSLLGFSSLILMFLGFLFPHRAFCLDQNWICLCLSALLTTWVYSQMFPCCKQHCRLPHPAHNPHSSAPGVRWQHCHYRCVVKTSFSGISKASSLMLLFSHFLPTSYAIWLLNPRAGPSIHPHYVSSCSIGAIVPAWQNHFRAWLYWLCFSLLYSICKFDQYAFHVFVLVIDRKDG